MQLRPRLQLIAPTQVRLLADRSLGLDDFKKGDIVTMEKFHADKLVEGGKAEMTKEADGLESVNRWEQVKESKKQENINAKLADAVADNAKDAKEAKSPTVETDEPLAPADADNAGTSMRVTRNNPQPK